MPWFLGFSDFSKLLLSDLFGQKKIFRVPACQHGGPALTTYQNHPKFSNFFTQYTNVIYGSKIQTKRSILVKKSSELEPRTWNIVSGMVKKEFFT